MSAQVFEKGESHEAATVVLGSTGTRNLLLNALIDSGAVLSESWQGQDERTKRSLEDSASEDELLSRLVEAGLLTAFQASHVRTAGVSGLVMGNYRLLEQIGAGGMGIVYRGEHMLLRRPVAVKVLRTPADPGEILLQRFFVEMRALARIRHPNIVWALDAGTTKSNRPNEPQRHFLVMEYVAGMVLEALAAKNPLSQSQACELAYELAGALDETHKVRLTHRDIKPSNILITPQGRAKLLDFGLALHFGQRRLTMPGTMLGTLGYMAPEQISDAAGVDIRADIFGLGASIFYGLTGVCPFPAHGPITQHAASRLVPQIPDLRKHRPDISAEFEAVVRRMMAHERDERYPTPQSLQRALLPFVNASNRFEVGPPRRRGVDELPAFTAALGQPPEHTSVSRVLLVDDQEDVRRLCQKYLAREGFLCSEAGDGAEALDLLAKDSFDLVVLDVDMPGLSGAETLERLRCNFPRGYLKVIMMSGRVSPDEMSSMLALGADDYLAKPFSRLKLVSRVKASLAHKAIQDRSDWLNQQLMHGNVELERSLDARSSDLSQVRRALLYALAKIVASRTTETPGHLTRMAQYVKVLAKRARTISHLASVLDDTFIQMLETCAPMHDIGNVAMPDHILRPRAGEPLTAEDRIIMQAHTTIGAETLAGVAKRDKSAAAFWQMAMDITRHHHEAHDGTGYPEGLAGRNIPIAARLVAIADAYDTFRTEGTSHQGERASGVSGGRGLSHNAVVEMIVHGCQGRFDPVLVQAFQHAKSEFDEIFCAAPE